MHSSNPQIELLFSRGEEKQGMAEILAERRTGNNFAKDFLANKQGMRRWGTQRENRLCGIAHLIFNGIRGIAENVYHKRQQGETCLVLPDSLHKENQKNNLPKCVGHLSLTTTGDPDIGKKCWHKYLITLENYVKIQGVGVIELVKYFWTCNAPLI